MDRVSERDRSSRKAREERERERDADYYVRDREVDKDRKRHRHHHGGEERRHERHRESERRHHSIDDSPPESDLRRFDRSPDRHRDSVERRNISRGNSPSDADRIRARDSVERDRDGDRRHRRSAREDLENGGERKQERSSNKVRRSVEREGFSYDESMERHHRKRKDNRGSDDEEIENNHGKRARISDVEHRKSLRRVEDDLEDVSVLSEDSKEGRKGKIYKDRRKEEITVTDDDMKHRHKKVELEMNGSTRHGRRSRDDTDQEEKMYAEDGKETARKERSFKDEVKEEKLERSLQAKPHVSSDNSVVESKMAQLANANSDRSNVFPPMSGSSAKDFAGEPLAVASKVSKASSNSPSIHTKMEQLLQLLAEVAACLAML